MAWYDIFDEETDDWYDSDDDGWGLTYDTWETDSEWDNDDFTLYDDDWYGSEQYLDNVYTGDMEDRWDTSFGGQANNWTGIGSALGTLFGGKSGSLSSGNMVGYGKGLLGAYMNKRESDKYNEMMQPLADLYRDQAADVRQRRANRDANIAAEYDAWLTGNQPYWDRADQRRANLAQKWGKTDASSTAWDRAANEQFRDATKSKQRLNIANAYDKTTGLLGGQLYGMNPARDPNYIAKQENPYLKFATNSIFNV